MSQNCHKSSINRYEDYYTQKDIKDLSRLLNFTMEDFNKFIYGQGCPIVKDKLCYFAWDVKRFLRRYL